MTDVTRILNAIEQGDAKAADELLPLVYEELRLLAAQKLSREPLGQTLQATALVHEAYIRLVGAEAQDWKSRGHFFNAAAEAMRRILVDNAWSLLIPVGNRTSGLMSGVWKRGMDAGKRQRNYGWGESDSKNAIDSPVLHVVKTSQSIHLPFNLSNTARMACSRDAHSPPR